jgi:hypothetical protein
MATTYSTSLKLALIGDGEQAGIWGQTTNTNLGTLLEQAITGVQTITMVDANYTLTNFNGVLNEARNAVLVVEGTNNAIRDVIAPLVEKQYLIYNNTTGGFAIRIRAASGFIVTIPNGAKIPVYCDGTNFYSAEVSATTGNFVINGNATVTGNVATNQSVSVGKTLSGTYSQSGTAVTVTITSHGLVVGNSILVDVTSGTGVDGTYSVATVTGTNTFTYTAGTSLTTSGNITVNAVGNLSVFGNSAVTGNSTVTGNAAVIGSSTVGKTLTGTYSQSGTAVTVTSAAHGLLVGTSVIVDITSGTGVDGTYTVTSVPTVNTFTYTAGTSLTTSGNVTLVTQSNLTVTGNVAVTGTTSLTGNLAANVATFAGDSAFNSTGAVKMSSGTTAQRPTPNTGMFRFNSTTTAFEGFATSPGVTISSITNSTTTATLTTATAHGLVNGSYVIVSGATPAAYNGTFIVTVVDSTSFTYTMASDPGASASPVGSYISGTWGSIGGAATGGGTDQIFVLNDQTVTSSYTIPTGKNASSAGPITIDTGVTVTVPTGSSWIVL